MKPEKKTFVEWTCSLSGCDGGNPDAPIWICGIEWGFSKRDGDPENYYKNILPHEITKGAYTPPSQKYDWDESVKFIYGRAIAKLYASINGESVSNYLEVIKKCDGSEIFKLNLYPIAFNSTDQ